jgi:serine/threonine protein kinase
MTERFDLPIVETTVDPPGPDLPNPFAIGSEVDTVTPWVHRGRAYAFVLDQRGLPIELGSGRFAKTYLGEELWLESKTGYRRRVAIKILQKGVPGDARLRFLTEKQILESVQRHPHIIEVLASGEASQGGFVPQGLRDRVEEDWIVLELLDASLEERLKGTRAGRRRDDLVKLAPAERLIVALDYVVPVAAAVEYAHLVRNVCHRDIKPANILLRLPDPDLAGDQLEVKLTDFNAGQRREDEDDTAGALESIPGTLFFQSPEQEVGSIELLVDVTRGSPEVPFFEDFYLDVAENDRFSLFNRDEVYTVAAADRSRKKILLDRPWSEPDEVNVRAKVSKAVGRPADIYSLGALLYYLVTGAYGNPKSFYDALRRFLEYDRDDENNRIAAYIDHEYSKVQKIQSPKSGEEQAALNPHDRFFSYKHYLDGNGEIVDPQVMLVIARAMIRNKPDSYCQAWDLSTRGITALVRDLIGLYPASEIRSNRGRFALDSRKPAGKLRRALDAMFRPRPGSGS